MSWTTKCYHLKQTEEKENAETDFDTVWNEKDIVGQNFICKIYYRLNNVTYMIAYSTFEFISDNMIQVHALYQNDELKAQKILPDQVFKGSGVKTLMDTLHKAKKRGAEFAVLLPLDDGTGKLFTYYYKLGFRCVGKMETNSEILYNAFVSPNPKDQAERTRENYENCFVMRMDLSLLK